MLKTDKAQKGANAKCSASGTYVYDKTTGKVIKISDQVPSLKKKEGCCGCDGPCHCHHH